MKRILLLAITIGLSISATCAADVPTPGADGPGPAWLTPAIQAPGVEHHVFDSDAIGAPVSYHIYLPEVYQQEPDRRFPVLCWLHGTLGGLKGIRPLAKHFGDAMEQGLIPPMLIVFVNGRRALMWVDSKDGKTPVETMILDELIPHIDAAFRTIAAPEGRIVEGFSSGGYGAMRFGLGHPDIFGAASSFSGGPLQREFTFAPRVPESSRRWVLRKIYGDDHEYFTALSPWELAAANAESLPDDFPLRVVIGGDDEMLAVNTKFDVHLTELGIAHEFIILPDVGHDTRAVLQAMGEEGWEFYRRALQDVQPTDGGPGAKPLVSFSPRH
ncbi:MAG: alpha/beta hydrolase [Armatimonadota bacterium]